METLSGDNNSNDSSNDSSNIKSEYIFDGTEINTRNLLYLLCRTPMGENFIFIERKGQGGPRIQAIRMQMSRLRKKVKRINDPKYINCLLYTSPSPRDRQKSRMPSSA